MSQVSAAAKAGMSERTARKYLRCCAMPSALKEPRVWRTRSDPFAEVWPEIEALLCQDGGLQAKAVLGELNERYPGRFSAGMVRTLQRRFHAWRARSGPQREVYFPQVHHPGVQAQSDFTDMRGLQIRIGGEAFPHLLYHFVLTYSNWEAVSICPSESFESLSAGLQGALWRLGGVPLEHRTDNLSAATHELPDSRGRDFTVRYRELLEHYGLRASRNFPGNAHENGDVESVNGGLKSAIDQRLRLRGSRDFASREAYQGFIEACVTARNAARGSWIEEERPHLRPLPARALPAYRELYATVSRSSTVRVGKRSYSVSSRLRGYRLRVRLHADIIELEHQGEPVAVMDRLIGADTCRIDYRHIIHTLVRKPGAFRNYVFRDALFPTLEYRRAYDALLAGSGEQADLNYVRILHLAASDGEDAVRVVLDGLLNAGELPTYEAVRSAVRGPRTPHGVPCLAVPPPDLSVYDRLLGQHAVTVSP
ncbi:MAG: IS21 family transposase [Acidobacteria bacterium]|nr:IS21 family transposase [Acidobacteriota bacterium]